MVFPERHRVLHRRRDARGCGRDSDRFSRRAWAAGVIALAGFVATVLSATPIPVWLSALWFASVLGALLVAWVGATRHRWMRRAAALPAVLLTLVAIVVEAPFLRTPRVPSDAYGIIYVIGDSLSAGVGTAGEVTWPRVLADEHRIDVENLAVASATARAALRQTAGVTAPRAIVMVEIGGNDLLGGGSAEDFERDLNHLLQALQGPDRAIVMIELPLPPLANAYGAAQRRQARLHRALLVPKRHLARILTTSGATIDGLHMSNAGHRMMAEVIWDVVDRSFARNTYR